MNIVATRPRYADSTGRRWRDAVFQLGVLLLALLLAGCGTTGYRKGGEQSVIIEQAGGDLPETALLDVWIELFEPGPIPNDAKGSYGITLETRKAEARFIPGHLKKTMQQTGYWGAVRVLDTSERAPWPDTVTVGLVPGVLLFALLRLSRLVLACGGCSFEHDADWSRGLGFILGSGLGFQRGASVYWGVDLCRISAYTGNSTQRDIYVCGQPTF